MFSSACSGVEEVDGIALVAPADVVVGLIPLRFRVRDFFRAADSVESGWRMASTELPSDDSRSSLLVRTMGTTFDVTDDV